MSKMRFTKEKYTEGSFGIAALLKCVAPINVAPLLYWFEKNVASFETIDVFQWTGNLWYIEVRDSRIVERYPANIGIGFSVDVVRDRIYYANLKAWYYTTNGTCFVRSNKWKRLIQEEYPTDAKRKFHWYISVTVKKQKKALDTH